jgi:hypothetical protein
MAESKIFESMMKGIEDTVKEGGDKLKRSNIKSNLLEIVAKPKTDKQADRQTDRQIDGLIDRQIDGLIDRQIDGRVYRQIDEWIELDPFHWITQNQALILTYLIQNKLRIARLQDIVKSTGVSYGTVRGSIATLVREKCISKPVRHRHGVYHGIKYKINETVCNQFEVWKYTGQLDRQIEGQIGKQASRQTDTLYSSSSYIENTTTIESVISINPDLRYWHDKGLTQKQFTAWLDTAQCGPETLAQYLSWFAFDATENGIEDAKQIRDVFNWFFRILEKTGAYPKPGNYKSHTDRMLAQERELVDSKAAKLAELKQLRDQKTQIEIDTAFEEMMADPECQLYRDCLKTLNKYQRKGKAFDEAMKRAFVEKHHKHP